MPEPRRRPSFAAVAVVAASVLAGAALAVALPPADDGFDGEPADLRSRTDGVDWPGFLGPAGDGKSPETGILRTWPEGGPPLVWQRQVGEGYGGPAVARGRLYLFDRHGEMARLTCLESETGREIWRSEYRSVYEDYYGYSRGPRTTPTVDGDRVYTYGVEGRLRCHRVSDGTLLWEVDTADRFGVVQNFFGVGSSPVVDGDLLLAMVGGSPPDSPPIHSGRVTANGSGIVAFDKRSGAVRYRSVDELASYSGIRLAELGGRRRGLTLARGGLVIFDPQSGRVDHRFPWRAKLLESVNAATPVPVGDTVFITETYGPGGALLRLAGSGAKESLEVVWQDSRRDRSLACHWSTPIQDRGVLYGSHGRGSGDAELRAVDHATGEVLWRQPGLKRATLLHVDGHLVVLGEYGELSLVAADPERYRLIASATPVLDGEPLLRFPAWNPPVLSHGLLYLRGRDRLVALELIPPPAETSPAEANASAAEVGVETSQAAKPGHGQPPLR